MRDIKFRGFNSEIKRMFYPCKSNNQTLSFYDNRVEVDLWCNDGVYDNVPVNFLMQYTGLKDKNGVEIYEGDILVIAGYGDYECVYPFIELYEAAIEDDIGAIKGNIYESPEPLGE